MVAWAKTSTSPIGTLQVWAVSIKALAAQVHRSALPRKVWAWARALQTRSPQCLPQVRALPDLHSGA